MPRSDDDRLTPASSGRSRELGRRRDICTIRPQQAGRPVIAAAAGCGQKQDRRLWHCGAPVSSEAAMVRRLRNWDGASVEAERAVCLETFRALGQQFNAAILFAQRKFRDLDYFLRQCRTPPAQALTYDEWRKLIGPFQSLGPFLSAAPEYLHYPTKKNIAHICGFHLVPLAAAAVVRLMRNPLVAQLPVQWQVLRRTMGEAPRSDEGRRDFWCNRVLPLLRAQDPKSLPQKGRNPWHEACEHASACATIERMLESLDLGSLFQAEKRRNEDTEVVETPGSCFVFRKGGDTWTVQFEDERGTFSDLRGFGIIAELLHHPNPRIPTPATRLLGRDAALRDRTAHGSAAAEGYGDDDEMPQLMTDADSMAQYEGLIEETIPRAMEAAKKSGNTEEYLQLQDQQKKLQEHLDECKGLGGRIRPLGPKTPGAAARSAVRACITRVIEKLRGATPPLTKLADHLQHIKTEGNAYAYQPPTKLDWRL